MSSDTKAMEPTAYKFEASLPARVQLRKASNLLEIDWAGHTVSLSGSDLRRFCACSGCRAKGVVGMLLITESQVISGIKLMGSTGLQVIFSDGHDRGIYPWGYLQAIVQGRALEYLDA